MFMAFIKNTDHRVYIDEAILENKEGKYVCPICRGKLIVKNGHINAAHFAHESLNECDTFSSDMSEWHKAWQEIFPRRNREVVLERTLTNVQYEGAARVYHFSNMTYEKFIEYKESTQRKELIIRHRADVLACGYAIEFQHSPISSKEFNERNWFYISCGYKVIWIFDFIEEYEDGRIMLTEEWHRKNESGAKYKWNYASKTFCDFLPQEHKPQYIDDEWWKGDITVFFQISDSQEEGVGIMEKVIWAAADDYGHSTFKYFMTSYYPSTQKEFMDYVKRRKL